MYQQSEVLRLREQIATECMAMNQALYGFASGSAVHSFIIARMDRLGTCRNQLEECVGEQEATRILYELYDEAMQ
ncbi:MAG: hypothetical protein JO215_16980 [Ktedonobacteraceae bacterium]|nr:hypothetical protein [Ktedonobacteraceae bacterium]